MLELSAHRLSNMPPTGQIRGVTRRVLRWLHQTVVAIADSRNSDGSTFQLSNFGFGHDRSLLGGFRLSWARLGSALRPVMWLC